MGKLTGCGILADSYSFHNLPSMKKLFALLAGCAFLIPSLALASVMRGDGNITQAETITENAYVGGGNPVIAGTVQGDLLVSGGNVYVSGTVYQDAMIAGGTVNVTGHIGGDLRVFAGNAMIDGPVDGELMVYGGSVLIGPHAVIQGDVNVGGGRVDVDPSAKMLSKKINIQQGDDENDGKSPRPLLMDTNKFLTAAFWVTQLLLMVGMFVVVALMHFMFPNFTKKLVQEASHPKTFGRSFLTGLLLFIVMPVAAILCFITGIGGFLGALILIGYVALIITSILYGGVVFGGLLYELIKKPKKYNMGWGWLVLGVVGLHVVTWVPVIGWIVGFVFFLAAWGAMTSMKWKQMKGL